MEESIPELSNNEWLSRSIKRLHLSPIRATLIFATYFLVLYTTIGFVFNAWLSSDGEFGLARENELIIVFEERPEEDV